MNDGVLGRGNARIAMGALVRTPEGLLAPAHAVGKWQLVARDEHGEIIDVREWENIVVTEGKNHLLSSALDGASQIATWYLLLTSGTPTVAAGDTAASHAGWTEITDYSEGSRQTWTGGTAAAGSIDNSGSPATFTIDANGTTIGGAGLISNNTKGGTTGVLYAAGAFTGGNLTLNTGSTLEVTATFSV